MSLTMRDVTYITLKPMLVSDQKKTKFFYKFGFYYMIF